MIHIIASTVCNAIFAKHLTNEKVLILCTHDELKAIQTKLCEQLGGDWVWVENLKSGEALQFTDGMTYRGFTSKDDRYSDQIIQVTI